MDRGRGRNRKPEPRKRKVVDSIQELRLIGHACRIIQDDAAYRATEDGKGLICWQDKEDNLIDRYDGRSLLDTILEYVSKDDDDDDLDEDDQELSLLNFERFGALIEAVRNKIDESRQVELVNRTLLDDKGIELTAEAEQSKMESISGQGVYGAVEFDYGGEKEYEKPEETPKAVDDATLDRFALKFFNIENYTVVLRDDGVERPKKRRRSRSRSRTRYRSRSRSPRRRSRSPRRRRSRSRSPRERRYRSPPRRRTPPPRMTKAHFPVPRQRSPSPVVRRAKVTNQPTTADSISDNLLDRMINKLAGRVGTSVPKPNVSIEPAVVQTGHVAVSTIKKVGRFVPRSYGSDISRSKKGM